MAGTGKLTFGGININNPPYNAFLGYETKYWFLDGFDSQQFVTSTLNLISTRSYLKDWLISVVLKVVAPDKQRTTLLSSLAALARVFDPTQGEKRLIFDEFPDSYFMAKRQSSSLSNETASPYMVDVNIDFACTGPAYSNIENMQTEAIINTPHAFTVLTNGDSMCYPRYRYTAPWNISGTVGIKNRTSGAQVYWQGSMAAGDVLDFILDPEYGTPYSVFKNGALNIASVNGPAWPLLLPGNNEIATWGPTAGTLEVRWRDRYLVGQQRLGTKTQIRMTSDKSQPAIMEPVTFTVYLTTGEGTPLSAPVTIYHYLGSSRYTDYTGTTDANGQLTFTQTFAMPGIREWYVEYNGDEYYAPCTSNNVTISIYASTMVGFACTTTSPKANVTYVSFWGTLWWYNTYNKGYELITNLPEPINIWHVGTSGATYQDATVKTDNEGHFTFGPQLFTSAGTRVYHADFPGGFLYHSSSAAPISIIVTT